MSLLPTDSGVLRRFIANNGETVTLTTKSVTVDTSTDWDDETETVSTGDFTAMVTRRRAETRIDVNETGTDATFRYFVYVDAAVEDTVPIQDETDEDPATTVTYQDRDFGVVLADRSLPGIVVMEVGR